MLVTPFLKGMDIAQWLIENGYAFRYGGGKKDSWSEYLVVKKRKNNNNDENVKIDVEVQGEVVV